MSIKSSLILKVTLLASSLLLLLPTYASALISDGGNQASNCSNMLVVFARGSGQNDPDIRDSSDSSLKEIYSEAGVNKAEKQTAKFFEEFHKSIPNDVKYVSLHNQTASTGQTYNQYGYAAVDGPNAIGGSSAYSIKPTHRKDVANRYYESVKDGAEELAWYLEDQLTSCPLQQVVLGGYSQGAETVMDGINIMQESFRARIAYVALYGDPKFNPNASTIPYQAGSWERGDTLDPTTHGILDARWPYVADGLTNVGSWCAAGDMICDAGAFDSHDIYRVLLGGTHDNETHSNKYQEKWIPQSMQEIVKAVRDRLPNTNVNTNIYVNKNDQLWNLDLAVVIDNSYSMTSSLQTIKGNVGGLTGELLGSYWKSRVGIVTYNGTPTADTDHTYSSVITPFTNENTQIHQGIQSITAENPYYGFLGDGSYYLQAEQSAQYAGIMTAIQDLQWQHGAQKKIIVITNNQAAAHDPSAHHWTTDQVSKAARDLDPALLNLANTSCDENWNCDQAITDAFQPLADDSGGAAGFANLSYGTIDDLNTVLDQMELQAVASLSGNQTGYVNYPLYFSAAESYSPNAAITEYDWDCDSDGTWDAMTYDPHGSCTYSTPYNGMVTMRAWSSDSQQGSYATLPVQVIAGTPPAEPLPPAKPTVQLSYTKTAVKLTWQNSYGADVFIKVADNSGNVLGYAPSTAVSVQLAGLGDMVPALQISACDNAGCSEPVTMNLDYDALAALLNTDDSSSFTIDNPATLNPAISQQATSQTLANSTQPAFVLASFSGTSANANAYTTNPNLSTTAPNSTHHSSAAKPDHKPYVLVGIAVLLGLAGIITFALRSAPGSFKRLTP